MRETPQLIDIAAIRSLPRSTTPWQMSFRNAPETADRAGLYRLLIIVSAGANTIRLMRATTERALPAGTIVSAVQDAMTQIDGDLVPARPPAIWVDDPELLEALELPMRSCGVDVALEQALPAIDPVLAALGERPGLFSDRSLIGATCYEAELAEAAARTAAVEPWRYFIEELPLAVSVDGGAPQIVVVLGTIGQCLGVACYDDEATFHRALDQSHTRVAGDPIHFDGWSLLFEPACATTSAHRQAVQRRGLPIAHALYPHFRRFVTGAPPLELSDRRAARRVEIVLHAVEAVVREHGEALIEGSYGDSEHQLVGSPVRVQLRPDLICTPDLDHVEDGESRVLEEADGSSSWMSRDGLPPRLLPDDHLMLVTEVPAAHIAHVAPQLAVHLTADAMPCLVVRSTKKDARAALKVLRRLDGLVFDTRFEQGREVEIIHAYAGGERVGVLSVFGATHDQPLLSEELEMSLGREASHVVVVLVGGGTRRPPAVLKRSNVVGAVRLQRG